MMNIATNCRSTTQISNFTIKSAKFETKSRGDRSIQPAKLDPQSQSLPKSGIKDLFRQNNQAAFESGYKSVQIHAHDGAISRDKHKLSLRISQKWIKHKKRRWTGWRFNELRDQFARNLQTEINFQCAIQANLMSINQNLADPVPKLNSFIQISVKLKLKSCEGARQNSSTTFPKPSTQSQSKSK